MIGPFHESYLDLAEELELTIVPSFPQLPGEDPWVLADGRYVGDGFPWMSDADRASFAALSDEFGAHAKNVDPDDPWSHPEAERLDRPSLGDWLRGRGATPNVVRARPRDAGPVRGVRRAHVAPRGAAQGGRPPAGTGSTTTRSVSAAA